MVQTLLQEVKKQLGKISIDDVGEIIYKKYINLGTSYDMQPFVDVSGAYYHIKVCERRKVVFDYITTNVKVAAYVILEDYTYKYEYDRLVDRFKWSRNRETLIREKQSDYFKKFDDVYLQYYEKGISILNLEQHVL